MMHSLSDRTIAFAGICQVAKLVQQVARENQCDNTALAASINSIMVQNADQTIDIYGELSKLELGLETCLVQLNNQQHKRNVDITRYIVGLLALERRLQRIPGAMQKLATGISSSERQLNHFDLLDDQVLGGFANIYSEHISPLGPKLQIGGNVDYLKQSYNQNKIRALLLAGIRAAVLWRQIGGKRRQLLFFRGQYVKQAQQLLNRIN